MTTFYLIRHGQNDYVGEGKLAGWTPGVHLNEQGKAQSKALAALLSSVKFQATYTSPLERAYETALPLAKSRKMEPIVREGLGEINCGTWTGKSLKSLRRRKLWPIIQSAPSRAAFPEGESFTDAQSRIVHELEAIRSSHPGKRTVVACVFHSDPIKLAIAHYLGLHIDLFQRIVIEPTSFSILNISEHGVHLLRLNDTRATNSPHQE